VPHGPAKNRGVANIPRDAAQHGQTQCHAVVPAIAAKLKIGTATTGAVADAAHILMRSSRFVPAEPCAAAQRMGKRLKKRGIPASLDPEPRVVCLSGSRDRLDRSGAVFGSLAPRPTLMHCYGSIPGLKFS
jgi:hypothetical protein